MKISTSEFTLDLIPDEDPETSYLEQEGFEDRLRQYRDGQFHFIGVRASVDLTIPMGTDGGGICHTVKSPGLWSIETDSADDYIAEVGDEEKATLTDMLRTMGIEVTD